MNLVIHGLSGCLFLDMMLIWLFVTAIMVFGLLMLGTFFIQDSRLIINDNNIIDKILKLKNDDRHLYKFSKKLSKDNIDFLKRYKNFKFERVVMLNNFNKKLERCLLNKNEKRLYEKIESIIYYYDLISINK